MYTCKDLCDYMHTLLRTHDPALQDTQSTTYVYPHLNIPLTQIVILVCLVCRHSEDESLTVRVAQAHSPLLPMHSSALCFCAPGNFVFRDWSKRVEELLWFDRIASVEIALKFCSGLGI